MRGQILSGLMQLLLLLILWATLFAPPITGNQNFYSSTINATISDATVPSYVKTGLNLFPLILFFGLLYGFSKVVGGQQNQYYQ